MHLEALYPPTATDALARWDAGHPVWTIEMGGLGPGYEQAIQVGVIELCRALLTGASSPDALASQLQRLEGQELNAYFDDALIPVSRKFDLQLSGAQAGVIKHLAYRYLRDGWAAALEDFKRKHGDDRLIQVSSHWPGRKVD